jgi:hypothetical protein
MQLILAACTSEPNRWDCDEIRTRDGEHAVMLAETDDQEAADNIVRAIGFGLGVLDLGQQ